MPHSDDVARTDANRSEPRICLTFHQHPVKSQCMLASVDTIKICSNKCGDITKLIQSDEWFAACYFFNDKHIRRITLGVCTVVGNRGIRTVILYWRMLGDSKDITLHKECRLKFNDNIIKNAKCKDEKNNNRQSECVRMIYASLFKCVCVNKSLI